MAQDATVDFIAGSLGGTASVYVGQPFDTIKVKMQTFPTEYKGMVDCFKKTFITDGIARGLYAGTLPAVVANVAENSVLFAGYGFCQKFIMKITNNTKVEDLSTLENAFAGFFAAFGSSLTLCPTELIKCKLQAMREMQNMNPNMDQKYIGPAFLTKQILRTNGVRGLFTGLNATLLREMPGYFFFFGGYEGTRELLCSPGQNKNEIGLIKTMIAGAVGGVVLWVVIFPADVIKSRLQVSNNKTSFRQVVAQLMKSGGILSFYNGLLPSIIRTIPATAALFVVFEYSKKIMNSYM